MKAGRTLTELAQELERQSGMKKDYIASTESLEMKNTAAGRTCVIPASSGQSCCCVDN